MVIKERKITSIRIGFGPADSKCTEIEPVLVGRMFPVMITHSKKKRGPNITISNLEKQSKPQIEASAKCDLVGYDIPHIEAVYLSIFGGV